MVNRMSRAFVKEQDDPGPDQASERPVSPHPNYVTPAGLEQLRQRLRDITNQIAALPATLAGSSQRADLEREQRWTLARLESAIPVGPPTDTPVQVAFGSTVTLKDLESGEISRYQIVGEDEADPENGKVSWISPLARAVLGAQMGDVVTWARPAGDREVEVAGLA